MEAIYVDACMKCPADVSDFRDLDYVRSRVEAEGVSFLTITLPEFCADFERSLTQGFVDPKQFRNFRKCRAIPSFLKGMLGRIFDRDTGRIFPYVETADFSSTVCPLISGIRQFCLAFKKIKMDCTPERTRRSLLNFKEIEASFQRFQVPADDFTFYSVVSSMLWDNLVGSIDLTRISPKHGPGATSERVNGNQKHVWKYWHERLETSFPFFGNAVPLGAALEPEFQNVQFLEEHQELPVRVTPVPKTLKGPRIIAIEPSCMQYAQQGIRGVLYDTIESHWMTRGHVNFRDQTINQSLAMTASETGEFATIDLSDASDRVPKDLAYIMLSNNEDLLHLVDACRSRTALMPDGTTIGPLEKFASMGSALCFPIEAMYFYTICVMACLKGANLPATVSNCYTVSRRIYVYGDDIIVPTTYAGIVLDYLQRFNCKANTSKTLVTGKFRESCGVDCYNGMDVTPIYIRSQVPKNKQQASELISWVQTANHHYKRGNWRTASLMFSICERIIGKLPYVAENSSLLGRFSYLGYQSVGRWNGTLHRFEMKGWCPAPVYCTDELDGYAAMSKSMSLENRDSSIFDYDYNTGKTRVGHDHLKRTARHGDVTLKRRWVTLS